MCSAITTVTAVAADTNEWTKSIDGKWEEEPFWSLGRLPDSSQSILIDSSSPRTITLDATTAQQFSSSMTVSQLVLTGQTTILLDHLPAAAPLRVEPGTNRFYSLVVEKGSALINQQSTIIVGSSEAGDLRVFGGHLFQDGGSVQTHTALLLNGAEYYLTNGIFDAEFFTLGVGSFIAKSFFNQYGGTVSAGAFDLDGETYRLFHGELTVRTNSSLKGGAFVQSDGTHRVPSLSLFPSYNGGGPGFYSLAGGTLSVSNLSLGAFMSGSTFHQSGGTVLITNALTLSGSSRYFPPNQIPAAYDLSNGNFQASIVELNSRYGLAEFLQNDGNVSISHELRLNVPESDTRSYLSLDNGVFQATSVTAEGAGADIQQTGGELIVTGSFSFRGFIPPPNWAASDRRVPRYQFLGGKLTASDLEIAGELVIGSSNERNRIRNNGSFKLAGLLHAGDCSENLGRFILDANSSIDLAPGNAKLSFTDSSSSAWPGNSILTITNWSGSLDGRGDDQISFGTDISGLTAQQLDRIRFLDPAGLPPGEYPATILGTGELVPHAAPAMGMITSQNKLTLQWAEPSRLQTSTNVAGPYEDIPSAKSPYDVNLTDGPQRFFRLK